MKEAMDLQLENPWKEDRERNWRRELQLNSGFEEDRLEAMPLLRSQLDPLFFPNGIKSMENR